MKIKTLFFGITSDLVNASELEIEVDENSSVEKFTTILKDGFPALKNISSYAIAVNEEYAENETVLKLGDVVAVIPPVSGG